MSIFNAAGYAWPEASGMTGAYFWLLKKVVKTFCRIFDDQITHALLGG